MSGVAKNMQVITSRPTDHLQGRITVPGDKSLSHRALILAAIAEGVTEISGFLSSLDCLATLRVLRDLGVEIDCNGHHVRVHGVGRQGLRCPPEVLDFSNSGTALRLMTGLLCGQKFATTLLGDDSLNRRPMQRISAPLRQMGANIQTSADNTPPIHIQPPKRLHGICYQLKVASAQVKSCLLLATLYARGETVLTGEIGSRDHTERMLQHFSYPLEYDSERICMTGGGNLHGAPLAIPGDLSSAAFFIVAGCLFPNADICIENAGMNPTRDGVIHILKEMGGNIEMTNHRTFGREPVADIRVRSSSLRGIEIPADTVANAIDEFPVLFIAAAAAEGVTRLRGAAELRVKESDRIQAMAEGLRICGVRAETQADGIVIHGGEILGGEVDSFGDHRVAMAFLVAGSISQRGVAVKDCANIETSFPRFSDIARKLGLLLEL